MAPGNRAAWILAKQDSVYKIDVAPYTAAGKDEIVIKTHAVAMNPADVVIQKAGILLAQYPAILGCDAAGEVVEVHASLADFFKVGDRVIGASSPLSQKDSIYCYSGFQKHVVLKSGPIAKIPQGVAYDEAVVLPLGINTSASCLFAAETLGLKAPWATEPSPNPKEVLLVWGASSSVGSCAVQLGHRAGYEVVGVASEKNHGLVIESGAAACFDRNDLDVLSKCSAYLANKWLAGAFLSVDSESGLEAICQILHKTNGRKLVSSVTPGMETKGKHGVTVTTNFMVGAANFERLQASTWKWLSEAMEAKIIKYLPKPEVVGNGLESVQSAVDQLAAGVSGQKLVVLI